VAGKEGIQGWVSPGGGECDEKGPQRIFENTRKPPGAKCSVPQNRKMKEKTSYGRIKMTTTGGFVMAEKKGIPADLAETHRLRLLA
jgi:hypothetical protein